VRFGKRKYCTQNDSIIYIYIKLTSGSVTIHFSVDLSKRGADLALLPPVAAMCNEEEDLWRVVEVEIV
jgi:hypothetical protein